MIEQEYGKFSLVCSICNTTYIPGFETFQDAVDYAKENGWKIEKENGQWEDICPECLVDDN